MTALIILTSVFHIKSALDMFWFPKNVVFTILGFSLIASSWIDKSIHKEKELKNTWLGLILIYTILSFSWYFFRPILYPNMNRVYFNVWNYLPTMNIILALFLIQALVENTDNLGRWLKVAKIFCWLAFLFSVYAILQFFKLDQLFNKNYTWIGVQRMVTFLGNNMLTGNFLAMLSPFCLIFRDLRYKIFYLVILTAIVLTTSVISVLAFCAGLIIYLIFTKRVKLAVLLIICLALGVILLKGFKMSDTYGYTIIKDNGRIDLWSKALIKCRDTLFTGFGQGSFAMQRFPGFELPGGFWLSAHNEFVQIIFEGGIILFALVLGYLCDLFRRIYYAKKTMLMAGYTSALVSYLVICLFGFPLRISSLALTGIIYISALEAQT